MAHNTTLEVMRELIEFKDALLQQKKIALEKTQRTVLLKLDSIESALLEEHKITPDVISSLRDIRKLMIS